MNYVPSKEIKTAVHVENGKAFCQISYEEQHIFIPIELIKEFSTKLNDWITAIYSTEVGKVETIPYDKIS